MKSTMRASCCVPSRSLALCLSMCSAGFLLPVIGCQSPTASSSASDTEPASQKAPVNSPAEVAPPAATDVNTDDLLDPNRWLVVTKSRPKSDGGWATASFDQDSNKLTIKTRGVQRFTIDTGRIPINWERVVVLSLNGRNSELRQRKVDVLHFERGGHGQWIIVDP